MRKRCAGIAAVILVVLIAVGCVAVILGYVFSADKEAALTKKARLEAELQRIEVQKSLLDNRIVRIVQIGGSTAGAASEVTEEEFSTTVEAEHKILAEAPPEEKTELLFPSLEKLIWTHMEKTFVAECAQTRTTVESDLAAEAEKLANSRYTAAKEMTASTKTALDATYQALTRQLADDTQKFQVRIDALSEAEQAMSGQLTTLKDTYEKQLRQLGGDIIDFDRKVTELTRKEAIVKPVIEAHGKIFKVDPEAKYAFVDLGAGDRLVRGHKFMVFRKGIGDAPVWVAMTEVKDVFADYAMLSIVAILAPNDMPVPGDFVTSPIYDRKRARVVALTGDITTRYYGYEKDEAVRRLKNFGVTISDKVDNRVDFLVVGKNYENLPLYTDALQMRVPIVNADYVFSFIGD
ncbi:MAG: BRCT domain-containing protein [Planctomycetota bacterium]|nr:BRCT domain-containing protein [Planctomycetota bacterium]